MPATVLFDEADLESDRLGESDVRCSYPATAHSEISELRKANEGSSDEPLRETREPFRLAVSTSSLEGRRGTIPPTPEVEEALRRAARSSFASIAPPASDDRPSGMRIAAARSIEEAVLRVVEASEPMPSEIPKA